MLIRAWFTWICIGTFPHYFLKLTCVRAIKDKDIQSRAHESTEKVAVCKPGMGPSQKLKKWVPYSHFLQILPPGGTRDSRSEQRSHVCLGKGNQDLHDSLKIIKAASYGWGKRLLDQMSCMHVLQQAPGMELLWVVTHAGLSFLVGKLPLNPPRPVSNSSPTLM